MTREKKVNIYPENQKKLTELATIFGESDDKFINFLVEHISAAEIQRIVQFTFSNGGKRIIFPLIKKISVRKI